MTTYSIKENRLIDLFDNLIKKKVGNLKLELINSDYYGNNVYRYWGLVDKEGKVRGEFQFMFPELNHNRNNPYRWKKYKENNPQSLYIDQSLWILPHIFFGAKDFNDISDFWLHWGQKKYFDSIKTAEHGFTYPEVRPFQIENSGDIQGWDEDQIHLF